MRASENEQTGGAGQNEVKARFERIGWGPVDNPYHDLGTDLYLAVRDERLHDRLLLVGAQVKTGPSWFDPPEKVDGEIVGWWFYEGDKRHFDDWAAHSIPHLIVLHDLSSSVSYWVHVTSDRVVDTGQGCKILVPIGQTVDVEHRDALLDVAASRQVRGSLEGTAWTGFSTVPPGRVWRFALIAPRLVAPHRNRGFSQPIGPAEAAALIVLGRLRDLSYFSEQHQSVKAGLDPATEDSDWRLVQALYLGLTEDEPQGLESWLVTPGNEPQRAVASVILAAMLVELERHEDATAVLDQIIDDDKQSPIDHGWASIQRARARAEIGLLDDARIDADTAIRDTLGAEDDVTASAIASSATWLLYSTAQRGDGSLAETLTKGDTAVSWWRSQTVSYALSEHFDRFFDSWVADTSTRFVMEDTLTNGIAAAVTSGGLLGDQGTWRSYSSLLGRHLVIDAHRHRDDKVLTDGLRLLRRSGDAKALKQAARRLLDVGPLLPLAKVAAEISPNSWTHTVGSANLKLWAVAGDLLDSAPADVAVGLCLEVILDAQHPLLVRTTPRFAVVSEMLSAAGGLLPASSRELHGQAASALLPLAESEDPDPLVASELRDVVRSIRWDRVPSADQIAWLEAASVTADLRLGPAITAALARHGNSSALQRVAEQVATGNVGALLAHNDIGILDPASAALTMESVVPRVRHIIDDARSGKWSMYEWSAPEVATALSLAFPDSACWSELLELLMEGAVASSDKAAVCQRLARPGAPVPEGVRDELRRGLGQVRTGEHDLLSGGSDGLDGLVDRMALSLGLLDEATTVGLLARGVTSAEEGIRRQTALMLTDASVGGSAGVGALVGLANDSSFSVRRATASATAHRVRLGDTSPLLLELLAHFLIDPGRTLPYIAASNLTGTDPTAPDLIQPMVAPLMVHPSALVRQAAENAHGGS